jgi:hypothetical protein
LLCRLLPFQAFCRCLLYLQDCFRLSFRFPDGCLLPGFSPQDGFSPFPFRFHLLFHGILYFPWGEDVFQFYPVNFNAHGSAASSKENEQFIPADAFYWNPLSSFHHR